MRKILYLARTEADFERVVCLAIAGKEKYEQHFVFTGDFSPFYSDGIQNRFQRELFKIHGFVMHDFCEFGFWGRVLKKLSLNQNISTDTFLKNKKKLLSYLFNIVLRGYLNIRKGKVVSKILKTIGPDILLTDQSNTDNEYLPEMFRAAAFKKGIPSYLFTHGAAGGLHSEFSNLTFDSYDNYMVFACSVDEPNAKDNNRIVLGDMSSSYPYVHYLNTLKLHEISFLDDRKYKVGIMVGGTGPLTSTTGWHVMEEIIIDLSENENVAMVLKLHPREAPFLDLRMLKTFENLLIVGKETDRSRVSKWADILVCSDHCSTIFEPMILGKKVVAIEGRHIPRYKDNHSPLNDSSVKHITSADEFKLEIIPNAEPDDVITNRVAWGGHGKVDLAELLLNTIEERMSGKPFGIGRTSANVNNTEISHIEGSCSCC